VFCVESNVNEIGECKVEREEGKDTPLKEGTEAVDNTFTPCPRKGGTEKDYLLVNST
jgi:hypothetical protein